MRDRFRKTFSFLRTTAIGGLVFLLPLAVVGGLLGYLYNLAHAVYQPLREYIPVDDAYGVSLLFAIAVLIVLILCFACGLAARRAMGRRFSQTIEKRLVMVFPKYAIYKDIVAGNLGGDELAPTLKPVTVRLDDVIRIGFEAGRTPTGLVIVYLPGSPDPWLGAVVLVAADRVQPLDVTFNETAAICERLGRDSAHLLANVTRT
jgi:uncharacterized membrane protein